jgi:hypothetical protein
VRPALLLFCFGTPAEVEGVTYARRKFLFFRDGPAKKVSRVSRHVGSGNV